MGSLKGLAHTNPDGQQLVHSIDHAIRGKGILATQRHQHGHTQMILAIEGCKQQKVRVCVLVCTPE